MKFKVMSICLLLAHVALPLQAFKVFNNTKKPVVLSKFCYWDKDSDRNQYPSLLPIILQPGDRFDFEQLNVPIETMTASYNGGKDRVYDWLDDVAQLVFNVTKNGELQPHWIITEEGCR